MEGKRREGAPPPMGEGALDGADGPAQPSSGVQADRAFFSWYREYRVRLRARCIRLLKDEAAAEDVVQETFLRAWSRRNELAGDEVLGWLSRVAHNLCIDHIRARKRTLPLDEATDVSDGTDPALPIEMEEVRGAVGQAFAQLNPRQREVLYLREVEGTGYEDLASRFGVSLDGARQILHRARQGLRDRLVAAGHGTLGGIVAVRVRLRSLARRLTDALPFAQPTLASTLQVAATAAAIAGVVIVGVGASHGPASPTPLPRATAVASMTPAVNVPRIDVAAEPDPASTPAASTRPGIQAGVDRATGGGQVAGGLRNPATGTNEYFWVEVWRDQSGAPSTVLSGADAASGSVCDAETDTCEALDRALRDPSVIGAQR